MKRFLYLLILCLGMSSATAFAQDEAETDSLADYKTACLAAIDNISLLGDGFAIRSMVSVAKASLNICRNKDDMRRAMTVLRAGVAGYLRTTSTFPDGQVFTGMVGNHSFDTGDLSTWYCLGFDLSQIGPGDLANAISGGDVSGLANAVKVNEWNEDTKAVENKGGNAVEGGHQKYYLNSSQLIMQPILGLPAGIYSFNAKVACNSSLFGLTKVHLDALVIPTSIVQEVLGDVISDNVKWGEFFSNFDLTKYIVPFLQSGKLYSSSTRGQGLGKFTDGELRFVVDKGDILIIGINAGLLPFVGTEQFRADNLQLTGLRATDGILDPAKAGLAEALQGLEPVEANYNADTEGTQPAFTYDKSLTLKYNAALSSAQEKYEDGRLADILSQKDLNNIDGIDAVLENYFQREALTLSEAKETFDRQAFIAPQDNEAFNILMKDDWISVLTPKWTGNAVSIDENLSMRFSQQPGQSPLALAFSFEQASDEYTNRLLASASDLRDKYYLAQTTDGIVLTTDRSEALVIEALPSFTTEGEVKLMAGELFLGTSSSSNTLIATGEGSLLRPTRTGLSVVPAAEMELTVSIPAGQNASTLILPFDAELPEGVSACSVTDINADLLCIEGETRTNFKANTPYVIMADEGESYTFSGVPHAFQTAYGEGLLVGTYTTYTTQGEDEYKLTTDEDGFTVFSRGSGQPLEEGECYLKCDSPGDIIYLNQLDAATGITSVSRQDHAPSPWYDLGGRRVNASSTMPRHSLPEGIYIRNGKKILR